MPVATILLLALLALPSRCSSSPRRLGEPCGPGSAPQPQPNNPAAVGSGLGGAAAAWHPPRRRAAAIDIVASDGASPNGWPAAEGGQAGKPASAKACMQLHLDFGASCQVRPGFCNSQLLPLQWRRRRQAQTDSFVCQQRWCTARSSLHRSALTEWPSTSLVGASSCLQRSKRQRRWARCARAAYPRAREAAQATRAGLHACVHLLLALSCRCPPPLPAGAARRWRRWRPRAVGATLLLRRPGRHCRQSIQH